MMSNFFNAFMDMMISFSRGDLVNYPDPAAPGDLGEELTQDDIDFVKSLRKEMAERFPTSDCTAEKTGVSIIVTAENGFEIAFTDPVDTHGSNIYYRVTGDTDWLRPNEPGNATGDYSGFGSFIFYSFTEGVSYDIRITNTCSSDIESVGVIVTATATEPLI